MPRRAPIPTDWKSRLKAELARDKKKTGMLAAMLLVMGIIGGRLAITHSRPADAAAGAPPAQPVANAAAGSAVGGPVAAGRPTAGPDRARWVEYLAKMDRTISRDLFKPSLDCFPPQPGAGAATDNSAPGQRGWFELIRKGIDEKQQEGSAEQARIRAINAQAESLKLRSTMLVKGSPRALIDGQVLREGDYVSGFRVKQIASNSCVVTKDGVDVELRMEP